MRYGLLWVICLMLLHGFALYFFQPQLTYDYWSDRLERETAPGPRANEQKAIEIARRRLVSSAPFHDGREWQAQYELAVLLAQANQKVEAQRLLEQALPQVIASQGERSQLAGFTQLWLAHLLMDQSRNAEALKLLIPATQSLLDWLGPEDRSYLLSLANLGICYSALGNPGEALACLNPVHLRLQDGTLKVNPNEKVRITVAWEKVSVRTIGPIHP